MTADKAARPWCAEAVYPGLKPFIFGTVCLPADARQDQIEEALHQHAATFLPDGFTITRHLMGALFFQEGN